MFGGVGADGVGGGVAVNTEGGDEPLAGGADEDRQCVARHRIPVGENLPVLLGVLREAEPGIDHQGVFLYAVGA